MVQNMNLEHERRTWTPNMDPQHGAEHELTTSTQNMDSKHEGKTYNDNVTSKHGAEHEVRT